MPNVLFCARIDSGDKHWSRVRSVGHQSYCKCILPEASNNNKNTHTQSVPLHIRTFFPNWLWMSEIALFRGV